MKEIVGASLSRFHDSEDQFEFLIAYADGREVGHEVSRRAALTIQAELNRNLDLSTPPPSSHVAGPQPCGIADPSTRDCPNMKEVGGGMDGERYRCDVCGKGYFLDYEEMK